MPPVSAAAAADRFMGVNVSALQLVQPGFPEFVAEQLAVSGLAPHRLLLELTETTRLDQEAGSANLAKLEKLGARLAIDDFGTGWASFSQLSRIPFAIVKIDRSFVAQLSAGSRSESLIAGILDLARRLGISVVAEGIENEEQRARLQEMGCAYGQGFHLARPMPVAKLRRYLNPAPVRAPAPAPRRVPALRPASMRPAPSPSRASSH